MDLLASLLVAFVALSHLGFLVLEMFFWDKPLGRKVFRLSAEQAAHSKLLAQNQGLYNGFLAAGLIYGLVTGSLEFQVFFLCCVVAAGVYGGLTVKRSILIVQALPAGLALALVAAG